MLPCVMGIVEQEEVVREGGKMKKVGEGESHKHILISPICPQKPQVCN